MTNKQDALDGVQAALVVSERWIKDAYPEYASLVEEQSINTLLQHIQKSQKLITNLLSSEVK